MASKGVTMFDPPPLDDKKAPIENVLELTPILDIGPDVFTNTRPLWHPPGARGVYGGSVIAQCLSAAQRTVPEQFFVHSMHCYFVLAGDSELPIAYHVERVRTGKSFATRTVQARQRGRPIFTTTLSFNRINSGGKKRVEHSTRMPDVSPPKDLPTSRDPKSPFEVQNPGRDTISKDIPLDEKRVGHWVRFRGHISELGGRQAHLAALAYMTDNYFIGTVSRVHNIPRFSSPTALHRALKALKNPSDLDSEGISRYFKEFAEEEASEIRASTRDGTLTANKLSSIIKRRDDRQIGMMVSLDHTIYFHDPLGFRSDDWLLCQMESPWAGEGRGLVMQKIWSRDGVHVATCVQEGVVRLQQDEETRESKLARKNIEKNAARCFFLWESRLTTSMGTLTNLPTELILIVTRQLRNIEDFLALRSTCRLTYDILSENTAPHTILDLLAASAPTFCSPHPYFLVAALARQTSEWALADPAARIPPLRKAFRGGIDALFAFCLEHAPRGLTLDEIRHLHSLRFSVLNPLTDAIDRMAGPQYNATPDFWEGGVSEPNTLYTEPSRATMQILIYGELFGTSFDHFLDRPLRFADTSVPASPASLSPPPSASSSVSFFSTSSDPRLPKEYPVFTIQDRLDFVKYCIPDWNCSAWGPFEVDRIGPYQVREVEGDHTSNLPADQTALRHVLTCRRWRRMWREGMAKVDKDDFSPPPPTRRLSIISIMSYEDRSSPSRPAPEDIGPRAHYWADHFSWVGDEGKTDIPNLSTENWRQKLYRDALVFQGIEGMQLITLPTHKISPRVLEKARWIRQKISELQVPIEMTTFGRLTPMLVSSAPDLSQELWLGVRGRWRPSVNV